MSAIVWQLPSQFEMGSVVGFIRLYQAPLHISSGRATVQGTVTFSQVNKGS